MKEDGHEDEDDMRNIKIQECKSYKEIQGPKLSAIVLEYSNIMKITKVNIGMEENPKK